MTLPELLAAKRSELDLSLSDAGEKCGVKQTAYKAWEHGWSTPKNENVSGIAEFLGITKYEVLGLIGALDGSEVNVLLKTFAPKKGNRKSAKTAQAVNQQFAACELLTA